MFARRRTTRKTLHWRNLTQRATRGFLTTKTIMVAHVRVYISLFLSTSSLFFRVNRPTTRHILKGHVFRRTHLKVNPLGVSTRLLSRGHTGGTVAMPSDHTSLTAAINRSSLTMVQLLSGLKHLGHQGYLISQYLKSAGALHSISQSRTVNLPFFTFSTGRTLRMIFIHRH